MPLSDVIQELNGNLTPPKGLRLKGPIGELRAGFAFRNHLDFCNFPEVGKLPFEVFTDLLKPFFCPQSLQQV